MKKVLLNSLITAILWLCATFSVFSQSAIDSTESVFSGTFNAVTVTSNPVVGYDYSILGFFNDLTSKYTYNQLATGYVFWDTGGQRWSIDSVVVSSTPTIFINRSNTTTTQSPYTGIGAIIDESAKYPVWVTGVSDNLNNLISRHFIVKVNQDIQSLVSGPGTVITNNTLIGNGSITTPLGVDTTLIATQYDLTQNIVDSSLIRNDSIYITSKVNKEVFTGMSPNKIYHEDSYQSILNGHYSIGSAIQLPNGALYRVELDSLTGYKVDSIVVIPTQKGYARLYSDLNEFPLAYFGSITTGYLEQDPSYNSYRQISYIRKENYRAFKRGLNYVAALDGAVLKFPPGVVEIYVEDTVGSVVDVPTYGDLNMKGFGKSTSFVYVYPMNSVMSKRNISFIKCLGAGTSITIEDLYIGLDKDRAVRFETYQAILKEGGIQNKIKLQNTISIRNNFWNEIAVGDTIYFSPYVSHVPSPTATGHFGIIDSIDITTKSFFTVSPIDPGITNNTANADTYAAFIYRDSIPKDTVMTYGKKWYNNNVDYSLIYNITAYVDTFSYITINNCILEGFRGFIRSSNTVYKLNINNSWLKNAQVVAVSVYEQDYTSPEGIIYFENSDLSGSGTLIDGGHLATSGASAGNRWGAGFYIHPNVSIRVANSRVFKNETNAIENYSASGVYNNSPDNLEAMMFDNVVFYDNKEASIITSGVAPTYFTNCKFQNNIHIDINYDVYFTNCYFGNYSELTFGYAYDSQRLQNFKFSNCLFDTLSSINMSIPAGGSANFDGCQFVIPTTDIVTEKVKIKFVSNNPFSLNVNDCTYTIYDRSKVNRIKVSPDPSTVHSQYANGVNYSTWPLFFVSNGSIKINNLRTTYRGVVNRSFIGGVGNQYINCDVGIYDSDIVWTAILSGTGTISSKGATKLYNCNFIGNIGFYHQSGGAIMSFPYNKDIHSTIVDNFNIGNVPHNNMLILSTESNYLEVLPNPTKTLKIIKLLRYSPFSDNSPRYWRRDINNYFGEITLVPSDTIEVIPNGIDSVSNIVGNKKFILLPGKEYKIKPRNYLFTNTTYTLDTVYTPPSNTTSIYIEFPQNIDWSSPEFHFKNFTCYANEFEQVRHDSLTAGTKVAYSGVRRYYLYTENPVMDIVMTVYRAISNNGGPFDGKYMWEFVDYKEPTMYDIQGQTGITYDSIIYVEIWRDTIPQNFFTGSNAEWYTAELSTRINNLLNTDFLDFKLDVINSGITATFSESLDEVSVISGDDSYGKIEISLSSDPSLPNHLSGTIINSLKNFYITKGNSLSVTDITKQIIIVLYCRWQNEDNDYIKIVNSKISRENSY